MKLLLHILIGTVVLAGFMGCQNKNEYNTGRTVLNFDHDWQFARNTDTVVTPGFFKKDDSPIAKWQNIELPHTAYIEPLVISKQQWQGICYYRKYFVLPDSLKGRHIAVHFGAAMDDAEVYLNGILLKRHLGGYLPFSVDITNKAKYGEENCLLVKLNNQDNPEIPPGKPIKNLDFNYYGGLYRNVNLIISNKVYISDPIHANRVAGGGILVWYDSVSTRSAIVHVQTDVKNDDEHIEKAGIQFVLTEDNGEKVISAASPVKSIPANSFQRFTQELKVRNPKLWSPGHPNLYKLQVRLDRGRNVIDNKTIHIGIRTFSISAGNGFVLNGHQIKLRGTNRHQDYPYIGYALSDNAQYRDAYKIKSAGFNFVRCSHYPPSPAFLEACDHLGIIVMDAIPGWQFFGDTTFQKNSLQNLRDMIRRDRNHPAVMLWEASLNESPMSKPYMTEANKVVHEELPYKDGYSAGWLDYAYDVFIPARQHAKPPYYWNHYSKDKPLLIAEYGDWEYYAQNAGFHQTEFKNLKPSDRSSRQSRGDGQERMAQQALNFQEAHNDNLNGPAIGDANWLMYDYNRGYSPDLETSGIMDIFRLPKFSYYFYKSQAGPDTNKAAIFGKPMIYIANFWSDPQFRRVTVYSNCDEVALYLNNRLIAKKKPDYNRVSNNLTHPPFTFILKKFRPGELKAVGYLDGEKVIKTVRRTPEKPQGIKMKVDFSGRKLKAGCKDVVFVHAEIVDKNGTIIPGSDTQVSFSVNGDAKLIGQNPIHAEAGIASILLQTGNHPGMITVNAHAKDLNNGVIKIISK